MHLYKTGKGNLLRNGDRYYLLDVGWDELVNQHDLHTALQSLATTSRALSAEDFQDFTNNHLMAPIGKQELWAAGVTYLRSRDARMEESKQSGGGDFYQKVYDAERPELFFKSQPHRVSAHNEQVNIRKDSTWNVPEPELTLYINASGSIQGYTVGNDMSSRSIEGENPLYLPQAKTYGKSCARPLPLYSWF